MKPCRSLGWCSPVGVGVLALARAQSARAHSFSEGGTYDQFLEGMAVPLGTPASLLLLLSTGAMIGLWRGGGLARTLPFMAAGVLLGLLASLLMPATMNPNSITWLVLSLTIIISILAIGAQAWPWWLTGALALLSTGICAGYPFLDHARGEVPIETLAGNVVGIIFCIILINNVISLTCQRFPHQWVIIGFRVAGSWLCAIAILMLAFTLRP